MWIQVACFPSFDMKSGVCRIVVKGRHDSGISMAGSWRVPCGNMSVSASSDCLSLQALITARVLACTRALWLARAEADRLHRPRPGCSKISANEFEQIRLVWAFQRLRIPWEPRSRESWGKALYISLTPMITLLGKQHRCFIKAWSCFVLSEEHYNCLFTRVSAIQSNLQHRRSIPISK